MPTKSEQLALAKALERAGLRRIEDRIVDSATQRLVAEIRKPEWGGLQVTVRDPEKVEALRTILETMRPPDRVTSVCLFEEDDLRTPPIRR